MDKTILIVIGSVVMSWAIGYRIGTMKLKNEERNYFPVRILVLLLFIGGLCIGAYFLKKHEEGLETSELVKMITGGLVVIGLFYSILSFEVNLKKNIKDNRVRKSAATFSAISDWYKLPLSGHNQIIRKFEESTDKELLKGDINSFATFFKKPEQIDLREAVMATFNYFETICAGMKEDVIDERFVRNFYEEIFNSYYNDWIVYFKHRRDMDNDPTLWIDFTNFVERWRENKQKNKVIAG